MCNLHQRELKTRGRKSRGGLCPVLAATAGEFYIFNCFIFFVARWNRIHLNYLFCWTLETFGRGDSRTHIAAYIYPTALGIYMKFKIETCNLQMVHIKIYGPCSWPWFPATIRNEHKYFDHHLKNTIRENEVIVLHGIRLISSHPLFRTGGCYEESKQLCIPKYQSLLSCHWMCAAFVLARSGQNKDFCCQLAKWV